MQERLTAGDPARIAVSDEQSAGSIHLSDQLLRCPATCSVHLLIQPTVGLASRARHTETRPGARGALGAAAR